MPPEQEAVSDCSSIFVARDRLPELFEGQRQQPAGHRREPAAERQEPAKFQVIN